MGKRNHSDLIHRQIAHDEIYVKNKEEYPKPFKEYIVHHIDENKKNNSVSNLYICTQKEHEAIHEALRDHGYTDENGYYRGNKNYLRNKKQIKEFLKTYREGGQTKLSTSKSIKKRPRKKSEIHFTTENVSREDKKIHLDLNLPSIVSIMIGGVLLYKPFILFTRMVLAGANPVGAFLFTFVDASSTGYWMSYFFGAILLILGAYGTLKKH